MSLEECMEKEELDEKRKSDWDAEILMDFKQESEADDTAAQVEHYHHQVKDELVFVPELQLSDSIDETGNFKLHQDIDCIQLGLASSSRFPKLQDCYVRLERMPLCEDKSSKYDYESNITKHKHSNAKDDNKLRRNLVKKSSAVKKKTYTCNTCSKVLSVKRLFVQHIKQHLPYRCKECHLIFSDNIKLRRHTLLHVVDKSKTCNNCKEQFSSKPALIKHIRRHLGETICRICNKEFATVYTLGLHMLTHTDERDGKRFICEICGRCYKHKSALVLHIKEHYGQRLKPHSCNACSKQFTCKSLLLSHKRSHTGEKPLHCEICNRKFSAANNLKKHKLIHLKEKRFKCNLCKKQFIRKDNLVKHKLAHTGERPYTCEICRKEFGYKENLVYHLKMHSQTEKQKPHICEVCGDNFRIKSHLSRHKLIHSGEKPFRCQICKKSFRHKSTLTCHMRTHTGEKPYACNMCSKRFSVSSNYSKHKREVHT